MEIYVLNKNFEQVYLVDAYKSLIWANRYKDTGDCELYLPATPEALTYLRKGYYLTRTDDDMVCRIRFIEIDTSAEDGNYLVVKGEDVKGWLDQRVVWEITQANGNAEDFARGLVNGALGASADADRQIVNDDGDLVFALSDPAGFTEAISEQVAFANVGEKIREYCRRFGWGYRVYLDDGIFYFSLYKGADKTSEVIFSTEYENLSTSSYVEDETHLGNVALVAGEGDGSARARGVSGSATAADRYEVYVSAKDTSRTITYADLTSAYPGGTISAEGGGWVYTMATVNILIVDDNQLADLQTKYPSGQIVTVDGVDYYQITDEIIADLPSDTPSDGDNVTLRDVIYTVYLLTSGYDALAEYGAITSFEGTIEPNVTFVYKTDYNLGDVVTVENEYGISVGARIVEVVEVDDDNGYSVQPKFENTTEG